MAGLIKKSLDAPEDVRSDNLMSGAGMPAGLRNGSVYLDYNATTPIDSRVLAAMMPFLDTHSGIRPAVIITAPRPTPRWRVRASRSRP